MMQIQAKRFLFIPLFALIALSTLAAQSVDITQIENRRLLLDGTIDIFFLPRTAAGEPQTLNETDSISLYSVPESGGEEPERIVSIEQEAPGEQGINFLLLLDNSGSMHEQTIDGTSRYSTARAAVSAFLVDIDNPLDTVGIASFNTYYTSLKPISAMSPDHSRALDAIRPPNEAESFTELYRSMYTAVDELAGFSGRRAMIVLSDGENYPYTLSGNPHPLYGEENIEPEAVTEKLASEGITLYAVHIGRQRDALLDEIARRSGGRSFIADGESELNSVYNTIRDEIRSEYRLRFRPRYRESDFSTILLKVGDAESRGRYFIPHFLGLPGGAFALWYLLPILAAVALILFLLLTVWEKPVAGAEISLLTDRNRFSPSTRVDLTAEVTVIGAGEKADMTIAGDPGLKSSHATIVFDAKSGTYTIQADDEFRINNQLTRQRSLKSGDVIDFGESTVVFDAPEPKKTT